MGWLWLKVLLLTRTVPRTSIGQHDWRSMVLKVVPEPETYVVILCPGRQLAVKGGGYQGVINL